MQHISTNPKPIFFHSQQTTSIQNVSKSLVARDKSKKKIIQCCVTAYDMLSWNFHWSLVSTLVPAFWHWISPLLDYLFSFTSTTFIPLRHHSSLFVSFSLLFSSRLSLLPWSRSAISILFPFLRFSSRLFLLLSSYALLPLLLCFAIRSLFFIGLCCHLHFTFLDWKLQYLKRGEVATGNTKCWIYIL